MKKQGLIMPNYAVLNMYLLVTTDFAQGWNSLALKCRNASYPELGTAAPDVALSTHVHKFNPTLEAFNSFSFQFRIS